MAEIYERLPREGVKAFEAFTLYLGLGPQRTLAQAAARCSKSVSMLGRWSKRFDWAARVKAHGAHLGSVQLKAAEAVAVATGTDWGFRKEKHREDEWAARTELMEGAREVLKNFREGGKGATLGDVARALDLASKLGRLASGLDLEKQPDERREDAGVLVAIEVVLDKIYGAAPAAPVVEVEGTSCSGKEQSVPFSPAVALPPTAKMEGRGAVLAGFLGKGAEHGAA